jgi:hypothetical protein
LKVGVVAQACVVGGVAAKRGSQLDHVVDAELLWTGMSALECLKRWMRGEERARETYTTLREAADLGRGSSGEGTDEQGGRGLHVGGGCVELRSLGPGQEREQKAR